MKETFTKEELAQIKHIVDKFKGKITKITTKNDGQTHQIYTAHLGGNALLRHDHA